MILYKGINSYPENNTISRRLPIAGEDSDVDTENRR